MIAVMGASGNTGGRISQQLLHEGENVRALGRSAAKLAGLESKGAEVLTGDTWRSFAPAHSVARTPSTRCCRRILQSQDLRRKWDQQGEAIVTAIRSGVRFVVFLRSVGADLRGELARLPGCTRRRNAFGGFERERAHPSPSIVL